MRNKMTILRDVLCLLLLLCLTAATLASCFTVSSEVPEAAGEPSASESPTVSDASVPVHTDGFPEETAGWNDGRETLIRSLVGEMLRGEGDAGDFTVYGEVGAYTLCYLPYGGDAAVVEDVFAGYRILSSTVGYPSATHLYLVGDDAVYTLRAAYTKGLIGDMGALYALLPEGMRAGYDPNAADSFCGDTDWFGFTDGVYVTPTCGMPG